jgi:hypothetical protein
MGDFISALAMMGLLFFLGPEGTRSLAQQQSQCPTCGYLLMEMIGAPPRRCERVDVFGNRDYRAGIAQNPAACR